LPSKHEETFKKNLFWGTGAWTQDLHLEPLHQPYFCEWFWLWTAVLLVSAWVARISGVSHHSWLVCYFLLILCMYYLILIPLYIDSISVF
jgi:hypothetical protein